MCYGLETTCCTTKAEKEIEYVARKEYRKNYLDMMQKEYFRVCPSTGKMLYSELVVTVLI